MLINKKENTILKRLNDSKAFIEYSNDINNVYKILKNKKSNKMIAFDDMINNMLSNKKLNLIKTELFIRARKLNILFVFIT